MKLCCIYLTILNSVQVKFLLANVRNQLQHYLGRLPPVKLASNFNWRGCTKFSEGILLYNLKFRETYGDWEGSSIIFAGNFGLILISW